MFKGSKLLHPLLILVLTVSSCSQKQTPEKIESTQATGEETKSSETLFVSLPSAKSKIRFTNTIEETDLQNYYLYEYFYNGGGVAIGDINNDGLPDIYFTGNLVQDRLYLNKGGLEFEDITDKAITTGQGGWHSGVNMADVNNDGFVDIYVCRAGWDDNPDNRSNLLYINNGDLTFTERAAEMGVADTTRSSHSAFLDYDRDGDLDLFVINAPKQGGKTLNSGEVAKLIRAGKSPSDRLFRNDGSTFRDVTKELGLWNMGYGLGVSISDLDKNGYPDIYVANDYIERDHFYENAQGSFEESALERFRHISNFGMGCDAADINNDGYADLMVVDMVSEDHVRSKRNMGAMSRDKFWKVHKAGYHLQYMFNTMQLNNGNGSFSEIANMAGIAKTDWSWAPLIADLDNDGHKDILVTNGYKRDMRDNDYVNAFDELTKTSKERITVGQALELVPSNKIRNYLYRNSGDLSFENVSQKWGFKNSVNSNGAAYADLDRDGDLDLVINNMDAMSEIYENNASKGENHFIQFAFEDGYNATAQGVKVTIHTEKGLQYQELISSRGFQSAVEPLLHFGLGKTDKVDRVEIEWPDRVPGMMSEIMNPEIDKLHVIKTGEKNLKMASRPTPLFRESYSPFKHEENSYDDFDVEVLLPHKLSELGPHLSTGDANGDGINDVFVGGAREQAGALLLGTAGGNFKKAASQVWKMHAGSEDLGSLFFDADGDGDQDLYVVSGSNETSLHFDQYNDRLYFNDGNGNFSYRSIALPTMQTSAENVAAGDIDNDGDLDLFVGGRGIPGQYPKAPRSYLLRNDGSGKFSDVSADMGNELMSPGLVTDALFTDHDNDGDQDLLLVGEWMSLTLFDNTEFGLVKKNMPEFANSEGWWRSLSKGDIDGDGDEDIIVGNIGLNNKFHPSTESPLHVYWNDFDNNGKPDIVLAKQKKDNLLPVRGRECSSEQCPMILDRFPTFNAFAQANLQEIYGTEKINSGLHYQAADFASYLLINTGDGHFTKKRLPAQAQISPINGSAIADLNGDGKMDIVIAGNYWGAEVETVRYDAGNGLILLGDGQGSFSELSIAESGFFASGDAKDLLVVSTNGSPSILVANNNDDLQRFVRTQSSKRLSQNLE